MSESSERVFGRRESDRAAELLEEVGELPPSRLPRRLRGQHSRHVFKGKRKSAMKRAALKVCNRRCVYCGTSIECNAATLDHVVPVARGGRHEAGNLVVACKACNQLKGGMLPLQFFFLHPWAGLNFVRYARAAHRALKRGAQRAVSLSLAQAAA